MSVRARVVQVAAGPLLLLGCGDDGAGTPGAGGGGGATAGVTSSSSSSATEATPASSSSGGSSAVTGSGGDGVGGDGAGGDGGHGDGGGDGGGGDGVGGAGGSGGSGFDPGFADGDRIVYRRYEIEGDLTIYASGPYDTELGFPCQWHETSEGGDVRRCLPTTDASVLFSDPECTDPVIVVPQTTCGSTAWASRTVEPLRVEWTRADAAIPLGPAAAYEAGDPIQVGAVYQLGYLGGPCSELEVPGGATVHAATEADLEQFARADLVAEEVDGDLARTTMVGDDGSRALHFPRRATTDAVCSFLSDGEALRCSPPRYGTTGQDDRLLPGCTTVVARQGLAGPHLETPLPDLLWVLDGGVYEPFAAGEVLGFDEVASSSCVPATDSPYTRYLAIGAPLDDAVAPLVTTTLLGTARLRAESITSPGGALLEPAYGGLYYDTELDDQPCQPMNAPDGTVRCIGGYGIGSGNPRYADPGCTERAVDLGDGPPSYVTWYVTGSSPSTCDDLTQTNVVAAGTWLPLDGPVYAGSPGSCVATALPPEDYSRTGAPQPWSAFPEMVPVLGGR
jgi:hypothetical protein